MSVRDTKSPRRNVLWAVSPSLLNFISVVFGILVLIGCTHNRPVLRTTYFLQVNVTNVVDLPSGILSTFENSLQHDIGIHDFYRYGLWGFCEGDNDTVVSCTAPKPGNATNPIASINNELKYDLHLPLPSKVQTDVNELESASLFIFACWIIGPVFGFGAVVAGGLVGCSSRLASWVVGTTASISFLFFLLGSVLSQALYSDLRTQLNAANFDILDIHVSLGVQMFAFVWTSFAASCLGLLLWIWVGFVQRRHHRHEGMEIRTAS